MTQITDSVFLGGAKEASSFEWLQENKITHIVNVADDCQCYFENFPAFKYLHIPIRDTENSGISTAFVPVHIFVKRMLSESENNRVLIHCRMGVNRSATVVMSLLVSLYAMGHKEASDYVRFRRPIIGPCQTNIDEFVLFAQKVY